VFNAPSSGADALEDPTIRQLGFLPDEHLPLLYQGAEAFVFPSLAEGFGLPVLEAMACGAPVICSNTTALPEISGGAAYLVPPLEIDAWAEAIDLVLYDSAVRQRMRSEGIRQAARFSWSHTTKIVRSTLEAV
jgi:glycosyltransferase involved in cell wall biosynthesis